MKDEIIHVHTLDTIINRDSIKKALGNRIWNYVNAIMNDDAAFGLRDKIAHGLIDSQQIDSNKACLLVHASLLISAKP
jgi:hypothetical protein